MKVIKTVLIVIVILVVIIMALGVIAPKEYKVERSLEIQAPKELVFNHVRYWQNWQAWSPWAERDTTLKVIIEGVDGEKDAAYKWVGHSKMSGTGQMVNTGVKDYEEITYLLHFTEPWESESNGYFRVADTETGTLASWGDYGEISFPMNIFFLFMNMDNAIGKDFERGLNLLKELSEQEAKAISQYEIKKVEFKSKRYASIRQNVAFADMTEFFGSSFGTIMKAIGEKRARVMGAPAGLYYSVDLQNNTADLAAGLPVNKTITSGDVMTVTLPNQTAYKVEYYGAYDKMDLAYKAFDLFFAKNKLSKKTLMIEEYITDPMSEPDTSKWQTNIYYFVE